MATTDTRLAASPISGSLQENEVSTRGRKPSMGHQEIAEYPPIDPDGLAVLKGRIEELVRKAAQRLT